MAFSLKAVANEFIFLAGEDRTLSPMKLQKLVYFAHGWFLSITGKPLIKEEIQAWQFGPVIPSLYRELKRYGNEAVNEPLRQLDPATFRMETPRIDKSKGEEALFALNVIHKVWDTYGDRSAIQLSNVTHMEGTPWFNTYVPGERSIPISNASIKEYFRSQRAE